MKLIQNMVGDIVWNTMHLKKKFTEDMAKAPLFDNDENRTEINNL